MWSSLGILLLNLLYSYHEFLCKYWIIIGFFKDGIFQDQWSLLWKYKPIFELYAYKLFVIVLKKFKCTLNLLSRFILLNCPIEFEFSATFLTVVYGLNWFWFVFNLVWYMHQYMALDLHIENSAICWFNHKVERLD